MVNLGKCASHAWILWDICFTLFILWDLCSTFFLLDFHPPTSTWAKVYSANEKKKHGPFPSRFQGSPTLSKSAAVVSSLLRLLELRLGEWRDSMIIWLLLLDLLDTPTKFNMVHLKFNPWKKEIPNLETIIFRFHVKLWGGVCNMFAFW